MNVIQVKNVMIIIIIWNIIKDKEWKKVFRLLVCSKCISCENKKSYLTYSNKQKEDEKVI